MTLKVNKVIEEINKTKAKITKLQEHLPILERRQAELENAEIIRLVRSSTVAPEQLAGFIKSIEMNKDITPAMPHYTAGDVAVSPAGEAGEEKEEGAED